jgi:hypothetical protein
MLVVFHRPAGRIYMAFKLLRGMETENIVRIIDGVRYLRAPEKIQAASLRA